MKRAEEILEKHMKLCSIQPINGGYPKFIVLVAMTEFAAEFTSLAEATKEMYPKEFTHWITIRAIRGGTGFDGERFLFNQQLHTLNEIFEYWKQNIRK